MERAIESLLEQHVKFSADIDAFKESHRQQAESIDRLTTNMHSLTGDVHVLANSVAIMQHEMEVNRVEMREAISNLILSNEVTRKLAQDIGQLAVQTSQRVTRLENPE